MQCFSRYPSACMAALLLAATAGAQSKLPSGSDPKPEEGVGFVLRMFERKPIVAIADLPGCAELHRFLRTLVQTPDFHLRIGTIVVDFGNPALQPLIDRYVLDGELVPESVLRHVWDDTTESPNLTWDSPVYAQFFDAVRAVNLAAPKEKRVRVVLGDAPILWRKVRTKEQWRAFTGQAREQALAERLNEVLNKQQRALVIAAPSHLLRTSGETMNTRALVEKAYPGQVSLWSHNLDLATAICTNRSRQAKRRCNPGESPPCRTRGWDLFPCLMTPAHRACKTLLRPCSTSEKVAD
jgi:hypothetical protein